MPNTRVKLIYEMSLTMCVAPVVTPLEQAKRNSETPVEPRSDPRTVRRRCRHEGSGAEGVRRAHPTGLPCTQKVWPPVSGQVSQRSAVVSV